MDWGEGLARWRAAGAEECKSPGDKTAQTICSSPFRYGLFACLAYALWAISGKLSSAENVIITNLIAYGTALFLSLYGLRHRRGPSVATVISGLLGSGINCLVLVLLARYDLTLVYPFVSFGVIGYLGLSAVFMKGAFRTKHPYALGIGVLIALAGFLACGVGVSGGMSGINWSDFTAEAVLLGVLTSLATGLWVFLAYYVIAKQKYPPTAAATWVFLTSFLSALLLLGLNWHGIPEQSFSLNTIYALLAGIGMFLGEVATYKAFAANPGDDERVEQTLVVLLSNSELVPVVAFSVLFLGGYTTEGLLGSVLILVGVVLVNYASQRRRSRRILGAG